METVALRHNTGPAALCSWSPDPQLQMELDLSNMGANYFRFSLREWVEDHYAEFFDESNPTFLDEQGYPDRLFCIRKKSAGEEVRTSMTHDGRLCNEIDAGG